MGLETILAQSKGSDSMPEIHSTTKNLFDHEVAERLHRQLPLLHLNRKRAAVLLAECLGLQEGVCAREPDKAEVGEPYSVGEEARGGPAPRPGREGKARVRLPSPQPGR